MTSNSSSTLLGEGKEVNISERKDLSAVGRLPLRNTALTPRKSMHVSYTWAPPAQTSEAGINPSFPVNSTRHKPNIVNTHRATNGTTHLKTASHSSVPDIAARPRFGKTPSAGVLERSEKRSVITRSAIKQALTSSSKVEERRRFLRTVVNEINGNKKEMCAPVDDAAPSPRKSVLVSSTTAPHAYPAMDKDVFANSAVSKPNASNIINSGLLANSYMHREEKTPSRVSRKPAPPRHGEMLSIVVPERHGVSIMSNTTPSLSGRVSPSWNTASTLRSPTPVPRMWGLPYLKPGDFEKPSTKKTDVTSMAGTSAGMNLTAPDTAHLLRTVTPASSSPRTPHVAIPDDVETCQGVSRMAQQVVEDLTRLETASLLELVPPPA